MKPSKTALKWITLLGWLALCAADRSSAAQRSFLMGTSNFTGFFQFAAEDLPDKDLLSLHMDDFLNLPWTAFQNNTALPASWVSRWQAIQTQAASSGKVLYLAVSPLTNRKTLTNNLDTNGNPISNWATVDSSGCYTFSSDPNAEAYKQAYIKYCKWVIDLIHPTYFSPGIEINAEWKQCPAQKEAFKQWYADVHQALKQAYPDLILFSTFSADDMYGLTDSKAWCGGTKTDASLAACFQQHLNEALATPADRIAFSMYPEGWNFTPTAPDNYTPAVPLEDMFTRVKQSTHRKIWISETGWIAAPILSSYQHTAPPSACGVSFFPSPAVAGEANMASYMTQLLNQAQSKQFDAVVWWENKDTLDATIGAACPCAPGASDTCTNLETLYQAGGTSAEFAGRIFWTMGLRNHDGTPRAAVYNIWTSSLSQPYSPVPGSNPNTLSQIQVYPNPMRPSQGNTGINFIQLPPGARLRVYTLAGEKVKDLSADSVGHANWDGKNESGLEAASGVYVVYVQGGGETKNLKVAIQR